MTEIRFGLGKEALAQNAWRTYFETSQRLRQALEVQLKDDAGLDVSDYNTLLLLWEAPERTLTMSALAKKLVFSPSRLNYRIKVLVDAGLVTKTGVPIMWHSPRRGRGHSCPPGPSTRAMSTKSSSTMSATPNSR